MKKIGITSGLFDQNRYGIYAGYSAAITELGHTPYLFSSATFEMVKDPRILDDIASEMVSSVDSLILPGGYDVQPFLYGEPDSPQLQQTDPVRDLFEIAAIKAARSQSKKILAICRGIQILNVALGGTLYQDLPSSGFNNHSDIDNEHTPSHRVELSPGSKVAKYTNHADAVNTLHHQAIKDLAPGLEVTARSDDGVVEAVESEEIIGVQWHPERMWQLDRNHLGTFKWLVE
ncbi:MAG: gamma-glutamyl-gamma-aminobutyrate hydrolase family protein [Acidimicrobiaceae bacterium]|nr:gamma-glutamyl-gamma-aminobutyrate hydrolase family protein [Acidimicrobiaceae bacterium]